MSDKQEASLTQRLWITRQCKGLKTKEAISVVEELAIHAIRIRGFVPLNRLIPKLMRKIREEDATLSLWREMLGRVGSGYPNATHPRDIRTLGERALLEGEIWDEQIDLTVRRLYDIGLRALSNLLEL